MPENDIRWLRRRLKRFEKTPLCRKEEISLWRSALFVYRRILSNSEFLIYIDNEVPGWKDAALWLQFILRTPLSKDWGWKELAQIYDEDRAEWLRKHRELPWAFMPIPTQVHPNTTIGMLRRAVIYLKWLRRSWQ